MEWTSSFSRKKWNRRRSEKKSKITLDIENKLLNISFGVATMIPDSESSVHKLLKNAEQQLSMNNYQFSINNEELTMNN